MRFFALPGILPFLFTIPVCLLGFNSYGQGITAQDQQKITAVNTWVQQQIQAGHVPTQQQMDSINKAVKELYAVKNDTLKPTPSTTTGSIIIKQCLVGGSLKVPENKKWKVKRVFVTNDVGGYNILVTSVKYENELNAGEVLRAPFYTAESTLLDTNESNATAVSYVFEIEENER